MAAILCNIIAMSNLIKLVFPGNEKCRLMPVMIRMMIIKAFITCQSLIHTGYKYILCVDMSIGFRFSDSEVYMYSNHHERH